MSSIKLFENLQKAMNRKIGYDEPVCFNDDSQEAAKLSDIFGASDSTRIVSGVGADKENTDDVTFGKGIPSPTIMRSLKDLAAMVSGSSRVYIQTPWIERSEGKRFSTKQISDADRAAIKAMATVEEPSDLLLEAIGIDKERFAELQARLRESEISKG